MKRAALAALLLAVALGGAAEKGDGWERFPVFVWFDGGPPPGPKSFAVLAKHGLAGCNVEGSDESDAARAAGLVFYVDHVAGKGDLFLRPKEFDADRAKLDADRLQFRPRRPNCFNDPAVMERLRKKVADSVARHAGHAPLAWVLDDELSVTRGVNPMDYCFGDECLRGLRTQLKDDYGTIARLNAAWGSKWRDFAEAVPPTTEAARRANDGLPLSRASFAGWSDHREFMRRSFACAIGELASFARERGARGPIGFTGGQFPSAFGGFEGDDLMRACTLVENYESGVAPELARSFAAPGAKVITTIFMPEKPAERASFSPWEALARAGRGDDGAVIWSSGGIFAAGGEELSPVGLALAEAVGAASRLAHELHRRGAELLLAPVALYENAASPRAAWMVDSWSDGATWPKRLTSWEAGHSTSATSREGWAAALRAASLPFRFVGPGELAAGALGKLGVRCLVLHEALALSDAEVDALERFVREGGLLLADEHVALFDEHLRGRGGAAQERLFGAPRLLDPTLDELAAEFADDAKGSILLDARELGTPRRLERGATLLLGRRLAGLPGDEARASALRAFAPPLRELLAGFGVAASPRLEEGAGILRLHRWRERPGAGAGATSGGELAVVVAAGPARAPLTGRLRFDGPVELERLEPKGEGRERLAAGATFEVAVDDRHAALVRWRPIE